MRHINSKKIFAVTIVLAFITVFGVSSSQAQATVIKFNIDTPFTGGAIACDGETVALNGRIHIVFAFRIEPSGNSELSQSINFQGVRGIGLTTGTMYRETGVLKETLNRKLGPPFETTEVIETNLVSAGRSGNLRTMVLLHTTLNANGDVTAEVVDVRGGCQ